MNRKFLSINILVTSALVLWGAYAISPCYAQEQYVAESFGLYSKGVEYYHEGRLQDAKEILGRALTLDPRNDEAQGYLDLVNAEIEMRSKGKLNFYQDTSGLKRESGLENDRTYAEIDSRQAEQDSFKSRQFGPEQPEPQTPTMSEDKIKAVTDALNEHMSPAHISGEYQMSFGLTTKDFIWKKANGDYNERNFRMISDDFPKTNTFDTAVYDRFKVVFDTNEGGEGLNLHSNITVDPWSFVGKTDKFTVKSNAGTDEVELELKYWSGTRSSINETFYTLDLGDSLSTSEYKVSDGKIHSFNISSNWSTFTIPEKEVDFTFQPIRELWFDFNKDDYKLRIFPYGLENQALSSDDPLGLSNHHIYWEPSPWLDDWVPGHVNTGAAPNDFWRGRWSDDLSFFTRDSDLTRLTALRGVSFQGDIFSNTNLSLTVATPKGLWQDYDSITALPGALRAKTQLTDDLMLGLTDSFRIGYKDDKVDSYNYVSGVDLSYDLNPDTNIVAEFAASKSEYDKTDPTYKTEKNGTAAQLAIKKDTSLGNARIAFTHMDEAVDAGLANYRQTRNDLFWGRHIHFKRAFEYFGTMGYSSLKYEDIEPFRIGDGIDSGRNVCNLRLKTKDIFDNKMDNLIDYRYVRDSGHKYVEGVFREENTWRVNPEWTSKLLFIHHSLPKTKGGIDPIQYDSDTGEFLKNSAIEDGKDPSLSTYSAGLEYAPQDWISIFGIYENTNDYRFGTGNYPNGLLNSTYFTTETIEGKIYRKEVPQLYNQGYFDLPPYKRFNIYRTGVSLRPTEKLGIDFDYTKNDFKFAGGIDDNINHFGTTLRYRFSPRLTGFLKYTFSRAYNIYRLNTSGDLRYENHHNVFIKLDYNVTEYGLLTIEFGEGGFLSPIAVAAFSPFGDAFTTLDTQHILRIYYHGVF